MSKNPSDNSYDSTNLAGHDQFLQHAVKRKVLIVDDNEDLVKILDTALKIWGHEVRMATDGYSGIEIAHEFVPDVVILDIGMPGMDGYTTCKVMRKDTKLKDTFFIAQTGWESQEQQKITKEVGFHYHLLKPFNLSALHNVLENKEEYMKAA